MFQNVQCFAHFVMIVRKFRTFTVFLRWIRRRKSQKKFPSLRLWFITEPSQYPAIADSVCISLNRDQWCIHIFQPENIGDALVHDTCKISIKLWPCLQLATAISMSFAVGNFVTLRLFILVLHFFSAEWISGSQFSVHSNIWMPIGRKLFEYSKRKKGKTRRLKKGITATQKGTHNTARASRPSGKRAPFFWP